MRTLGPLVVWTSALGGLICSVAAAHPVIAPAQASVISGGWPGLVAGLGAVGYVWRQRMQA